MEKVPSTSLNYLFQQQLNIPEKNSNRPPISNQSSIIGNFPISSTPNELFLSILKKLGPEELLELLQVKRSFRKFILSNGPLGDRVDELTIRIAKATKNEFPRQRLLFLVRKSSFYRYFKEFGFRRLFEKIKSCEQLVILGGVDKAHDPEMHFDKACQWFDSLLNLKLIQKLKISVSLGGSARIQTVPNTQRSPFEILRFEAQTVDLTEGYGLIKASERFLNWLTERVRNAKTLIVPNSWLRLTQIFPSTNIRELSTMCPDLISLPESINWISLNGVISENREAYFVFHVNAHIDGVIRFFSKHNRFSLGNSPAILYNFMNHCKRDNDCPYSIGLGEMMKESGNRREIFVRRFNEQKECHFLAIQGTWKQGREQEKLLKESCYVYVIMVDTLLSQ